MGEEEVGSVRASKTHNNCSLLQCDEFLPFMRQCKQCHQGIHKVALLRGIVHFSPDTVLCSPLFLQVRKRMSAFVHPEERDSAT